MISLSICEIPLSKDMPCCNLTGNGIFCTSSAENLLGQVFQQIDFTSLLR
ncbi:hypothetical protein KFK09_029239 [Dendrobium nobile]|uniref:Uncharacterized protein n=1 Tax=Dendrobium nobile TaxID=94219 RepID=A0A8T3A589_DENNO|nr:hypothetical protein KFK09_029239 [Dendrobium nobile]